MMAVKPELEKLRLEKKLQELKGESVRFLQTQPPTFHFVQRASFSINLSGGPTGPEDV